MSKKFIQAALAAGEVCLIPTDTIPGLSADPNNPEAMARLAVIKSRSSSKNYLSLVGGYDVAERCWQPLPEKASQALKDLWPGPVSVIWKASLHAPESLVSETGEIAMRYPRFGDRAPWLAEFLKDWGQPLPSTSVNLSEEAAARDWSSAVAFAEKMGVFVPEGDYDFSTSSPSKLVRILEDGSLEVIRGNS